MTIALDHHHVSFTPRSQLARLVSRALQHYARARRAHWQAAVFRSMDEDKLRDIGFSADYIRAEWQDFSADRPSLVAPPAIAGMTECSSGRQKRRARRCRHTASSSSI